MCIRDSLEDWKIIFRTIWTVLKREGINSETSETMEEFIGTDTPETKDNARV